MSLPEKEKKYTLDEKRAKALKLMQPIQVNAKFSTKLDLFNDLEEADQPTFHLKTLNEDQMIKRDSGFTTSRIYYKQDENGKSTLDYQEDKSTYAAFMYAVIRNNTLGWDSEILPEYSSDAVKSLADELRLEIFNVIAERSQLGGDEEAAL